MSNGGRELINEIVWKDKLHCWTTLPRATTQAVVRLGDGGGRILYGAPHALQGVAVKMMMERGGQEGIGQHLSVLSDALLVPAVTQAGDRAASTGRRAL